MDRSEKQEEITFLQGCFAKSTIALCANYRGLTVGQITSLRKQLRDGGSVARVSKNTLAKISAQKGLSKAAAAEIEKFVKLMDGPSLFVFSESDPVTPAKILTKFAKGNDKLKIRGAIFEGACMDAKGVQDLSLLPSREELLAKLLALMNAPATQLLRLIQAPGTQVVRVLNAQKDKLSSSAPA